MPVPLFHDPSSPKVVEPPGLRAPLCSTLAAVTEFPLVVIFVFQDWLTVWPLVNVQVTFHPLIAATPAVTLISAWNPPSHWFVIA